MNRTEPVELTNMCMIYSEDFLLMQNRIKDDWKGWVFPGSHVEKDEIIADSVIREVKEETGLDIEKPVLCGIKEFKGKNGRYIVFFYKTNKFSGKLCSSDEGEVKWIKRAELNSYPLVSHFREMLEVFDNPSISEFYYDENWKPVLK